MRAGQHIGSLGLVALLAGCGAFDPASASGEDASTGEDGWTSWGASTSTGAVAGSSTTTSGRLPEPSNFLAEHDVYGGVHHECTTWAQNCPLGQKCTVWANDGSNAWNAWKCVPIDPDPDAPGEPCVAYESPTSGLDSCELHSMCWDVDRDTLEGTCVSFCNGSEANPLCSNPDMQCSIASSVIPSLCFPACDPLAQDCPAGQACYGIDQSFVCAPDQSGDGGTLGDPCEFINACDPGYECFNADLVPGCEGSAGCCTPHCDLDEPDPCVAGQTCLPWFEEGTAPPGYEDIGVCQIPGS